MDATDLSPGMVKDVKFSFKKTFASLCAEGCIYCNGDKAFLTDEGQKQLNQLQMENQ